MAKISGILTDGAGQIINDCTIELYAKKTTNKVLTQTQTFQVSENGKYSMNVLPCEYEVSLIINGFPKKRLGIINVYSDSVDGTLNDYLINPEDSDLTPEFLKQIFDARNEAIKSAEDAKSWASTIDNSNFIKKTGEDNQSINGSLDVKVITEQDQRVYSPNNKPTADDIGALSVTLNNEDGKKEIDSFLRFKKRPEFNNSDILTRDDYVGLLNKNGYQKLPSGLIIQWGIANSSDRTGIVIPPIAFPNRVLSVHFTDTAGSVSGGAMPISWVLNSTSVNGFAWCATEPPGFFSFFAIGF